MSPGAKPSQLQEEELFHTPWHELSPLGRFYRGRRSSIHAPGPEANEHRRDKCIISSTDTLLRENIRRCMLALPIFSRHCGWIERSKKMLMIAGSRVTHTSGTPCGVGHSHIHETYSSSSDTEVESVMFKEARTGELRTLLRMYLGDNF